MQMKLLADPLRGQFPFWFFDLLDHEFDLVAAERMAMRVDAIIKPKVVIAKMANPVTVRLKCLFEKPQQLCRREEAFVIRVIDRRKITAFLIEILMRSETDDETADF